MMKSSPDGVDYVKRPSCKWGGRAWRHSDQLTQTLRASVSEDRFTNQGECAAEGDPGHLRGNVRN